MNDEVSSVNRYLSSVDDEAAWNYQYESMTEDAPSAYAVIFPFVVQILGVIIFFLLKHFRIPIPYAACIFLLGTFMGAGAAKLQNPNQLAISIFFWNNLHPDVLLLVFLPGLLFRDAIEVNINLFVVSMNQIFLLAYPMVLMGTGLVAAVVIYLLPYAWNWSLSLTLGAILSSTDPVAVAAVLKEAGAPPRLQMHISGESLLNDGSAFVYYRLFSQIFLSQIGAAGPVTVADGIELFFRMSAGGVAVGLAFSGGLCAVLYILDSRLEKEYHVLQAVAALSVAYISYYVADTVLRMSGIVACVTCGITSAALGKGLISDHHLMDTYLKLMEHMLNTLLFALGGSGWGIVIASKQGAQSIYAADWGYLMLFYLLVLVVRFVQVFTFYPVFRKIGLKSNWREAVFLSYGGLRGAVGIAMAISLYRTVINEAPSSEVQKFATTLVFLSGGVSLLTLLLNGTAAGPVLRLLKLSKPVPSRERALQVLKLASQEFLMAEYKRLRDEPRFEDIDLHIVQYHVPWLKVDSELMHRAPMSTVMRFRTLSEIPVGSEHHSMINRAAEKQDLKEAVVEMRQVFLELMGQAYETLLENGELDLMEDRGYNADVLKQGLAFAASAAGDEALNDWEYTEKTFKFFGSAKSFLQHRLQELGSPMVGGTAPEPDVAVDTKEMRIHVLRAVCFIEAHQIAERKLQDFMTAMHENTVEVSVNQSERQMVVDALDVVLKESRAQVVEAERLLDRVPDLNIIMSHYVSMILLNRFSRFVQRLAMEGVVETVEAQKYLDKIDLCRHDTFECKRACCVGNDDEKHDETKASQYTQSTRTNLSFDARLSSVREEDHAKNGDDDHAALMSTDSRQNDQSSK